MPDTKSVKVTTSWTLDPPEDCPRAYSQRGAIRVHEIRREVWEDDHREHWSVRGVPLTTKGNPNGGIDWRSITVEAIAALKARVLAGEQ